MPSLLPAVVFSVALLAAAPFWGVTIAALRRSVPGPLLLGLLAFFALAVVVLVVGTLRRREDRPRRVLLVGTALLLAFGPAFLVDRETLMTEAVERIHLVLYTVLALLVYRALRRRAQWGGWAAIGTGLATALVGLLDESVQFLVAVRTGEIYDVGLNLWSALCGALISVGLLGRSRPGWPASGRRRSALLLLLLVVGTAGFVHWAHLGHAVVDPRIGSFRTWVSPERFAEVNRERRERWQRTIPGPPFGPLEVEDRFHTEGGWRVAHRNRRLQDGDLASAWGENRILEVYFPAVLDIPRAEGGVRHRWGPEQRAQIAARLEAPLAGSYVSPVQPQRILLDPRPRVLWGATVPIAFALLLVAAAGPRRPEGSAEPAGSPPAA